MTNATLARKIREVLERKNSHCGRYSLKRVTRCNDVVNGIQISMFQPDGNRDLVFIALVDAGFDVELSTYQGMETVKVVAA